MRSVLYLLWKKSGFLTVVLNPNLLLQRAWSVFWYFVFVALKWRGHQPFWFLDRQRLWQWGKLFCVCNLNPTHVQMKLRVLTCCFGSLVPDGPWLAGGPWPGGLGSPALMCIKYGTTFPQSLAEIYLHTSWFRSFNFRRQTSIYVEKNLKKICLN